MYLVTSEQMRCFDNFTIETRKVPSIVLMDHAGKAVADVIRERKAIHAVVLCGKGNNGGDGWIVARWLRHYGLGVRVQTVVNPTSLTGAAHEAFVMADAAGVPWQMYQPGKLHLGTADVLVDALLGTGCTRPLTGNLMQLVNEMNQSGVPIIAVDVPTGVNASTGEVHGAAVRATETVSMAFEKLGTAVTPGAVYAGRVRVVDIGIAAPLPEGMAAYTRREMFAGKWGERAKTSHKGTYGRCGVYVGQMHGAALLSAAGAARTGAGLVILASRSELPVAALPDYVLRPQSTPRDAFADCQAVVIGPGLGRNNLQVVQDLLGDASASRLRGVIDADGLQALMVDGGELATLSDRWVLTPHPKECARLLNWSTEQVQERRIEAARELAMKSGAIVLLKGYRTIIVTPAGDIRVNPSGDAALAVGGSGDILAGMIGSLLAQGLDAFDAASLGAWLHGCAGELAGAALTPISTTATDIVNYISRAILTFFDNL